MTIRLRMGARRVVVRVEQHDGTLLNGQPTYDTSADWDVVSTMDMVPATYEGVSGGERIRGLQIEATTDGLVTMHSTPRTRTIKPRMRLILENRTLHITSVVDKGRGVHRTLYLQVREQADA